MPSLNSQYVKVAKKLNKKLLKEFYGRIIIKHIKNTGCIVCIGNGKTGKCYSFNVGWSLVNKKMDHYSRRVALFQAIMKAVQKEDIKNLPDSLMNYAARVICRAERYFKIPPQNCFGSIKTIVRSLQEIEAENTMEHRLTKKLSK